MHALIKYLALLAGICSIWSCNTPVQSSTPLSSNPDKPAYVLVIHGGAGSMSPGGMSEEREAAYRASLTQALAVGGEILAQGGTSLEAVEATIRLMEDDSLFNSGRGAVLTHEGTAELDASIMDGRERQAGAVAGVKRVKHPISAAREVMQHSKHVLLAREGAEAFAQKQGLEMISNDYFILSKRKKQLANIIAREQETKEKGTVGAVALDKYGNLAAGTSTGGMMNKRYQRVGDSPIIGAGTFADNQSCAVSCTGHGEYFIRYAVAYDVAAMMTYKGSSLTDASHEIIYQKLKNAGGDGGLIAVDKEGNIAMPFNTNGMFRGYIRGKEEPFVAMYPGEEDRLTSK